MSLHTLSQNFRKHLLFSTLLTGALLLPMSSATIAQEDNTKASATKTAAQEKAPEKAKQPDTTAKSQASAPDTSASSDKEACLTTPSEREQVVMRLKKMRPKPAAKLLSALPPQLAADLLIRMTPRQSAKIMNELPPQTGAMLVVLLSQDTQPQAPATAPGNAPVAAVDKTAPAASKDTTAKP